MVLGAVWGIPFAGANAEYVCVPAMWEVTVIGLAAIVGGTIMVVWAVRSEKFTQRVGEWLGRFMSWFLVEFNKNPLEDLGPKAVEMRERVGSTRRSRWPIATVAGPAMSYLIRLATLRFVGVEASDVDWVALLVACSLVLLVTMLPLTPGGVGVVAVGSTAILAGGDPTLEYAFLLTYLHAEYECED